MVIYNSAKIYIESKKTALERIKAIDNIIDVLIGTLLESVTTANVMEYDLDSGQSKVKCLYRSPQEVTNTIHALNTAKQYYINNVNGRSMHLVDGKNFRPPYYGAGLV